jgi:broad specificity phosphatase PhoE
MDIILVRHGRPQPSASSPAPRRGLRGWEAGLEQAPLDQTLLPPPGLTALAASAGCIMTSPLRRSVESATLLAPGRTVLCEPLFVEAGLPVTPGAPDIRPRHWTVLSRIAWVLGWSRAREPWPAARRRASLAAARLAELAREHQSVLLVGHGLLNLLIQRALRAAGWTGGGWRAEYWSYVVLSDE